MQERVHDPTQRGARKYNVTSYDVAEHARVSQSTVSRALRGETTVTKETRRRVLNAAKALGYQIDARASALRSLKVEFVAVILVNAPCDYLADDSGARFVLVRKVYDAISAFGFEMILSIQPPHSPRDDFIGRRRAQTSIVIGRQSDLAQWAAGVDRAPEIARFLASGVLELDAQAFATWLGEAVQSGAAACDIALADAPSYSSRISA
jgi:transcriptional regulator with XRE-family HTH domain